MRKIKVMIASMFGAIALVFACVFGTRINAATITAEFSANDLDADGVQIQADAETPFYQNALFSLNMTGTGAYVSTIGGTETYNADIKYSTETGFTATANDNSGKTYTKAILPTATTSPKDNVNRGINLTAKDNKINVTIYFTCTDGVFPYTTDKDGNSKGASYGKSGDIKVNGTTISTVSGNKARNVAYAASAEIPANTTVLLDSTANRLALFGIVASYEAAEEGQTSITFKDGTSDLNTIIYDSGDTIDYVPSKANHTFDGWYTDSDLAEEHKLADNYTVDGTITILYAKFTEFAKYTVYYYIDGVLDKTENNVYVGTSITYSPTYDNYGFDGWYTDSNCSQAIASNYTVSGNVSLYGKKVQLSYNLDQSHMTTYAGGSITHYNNTIFNFIDTGSSPSIVIDESTKTLPDNTTSTYRINKANTSSATDKLITFKAPYDGTVKIWAAAGNSDKNFYICETTYSTTSYIARQATPAKNELFEITAEIESGKTYVIGSDSRFYIYGIFVEKEPEMADNTSASVFAEMNDTTGTLRFVGTLTGITSLDNIASIELVLKKKSSADTDYVATKSKIYLTTCYTSVTGTTQTCAAANGKYYVIFRLNNADSLATGTKISKELIITFTDGSTTTSNASEITM